MPEKKNAADPLHIVEQVSAAAEALVGEGLQPTIRAVRERIGSGSPNTVHRHLTAWRAARPQAATTAAAELPQALTSAIAVEIERAAAQARAEVADKLVQAQAEAAELSAAGELIEQERDSLIEQVAALARERDTLVGKAQQQTLVITDQVHLITREQHAAEAARVELAKANLKLESLIEKQVEQAAEIAKLKADLADAQTQKTAAQQQAAVLTARLEASADLLARAEAKESQTSAQIAANQAAHKSEIAVISDQLRQATGERDEAKNLASTAREKAAHLAGELAAIKQRDSASGPAGAAHEQQPRR